MEGVYRCRLSGCSVKQFIAFMQVIHFKYFGTIHEDMSFPLLPLTIVPPDYPLDTINTDIMLQYSNGDPATNPADIATLKSNTNSIVCTHVVASPTFAHADFVLGTGAHVLVYEPMVEFWRNGICPN